MWISQFFAVPRPATSVSALAALSGTSWLWPLSRASGMLAAILLALLIISGISQVTGLSYHLLEPLPAWRLHRALATALGICIFIHTAALLIYAGSLSAAALAVLPFATSTFSGFSAMLSLAAAAGILVVFAAIIFTLGTVFWHNSQPLALRILLYLLCIVLAVVFLGGLYMSIPILALAGGIGIVISAFIRRTKGTGIV